MLKKSLNRYCLLPVLVCFAIFSCSKDDDAMGEKRCKITNYSWLTYVIDSNTGESSAIYYDLPITYDDDCKVLTSAIDSSTKDSCVYEGDLLTKIYKVKHDEVLDTTWIVNHFNLSYGQSDQPEVISLESFDFIHEFDSLYYQDGELVKVVNYKPYGPAYEFVKFSEKEYEYHPDGNLKRVATYKFYPTEVKTFLEEELYLNFTDVKNPWYKSPFPGRRNISLCKTLYANYERYDADHTQTAGASFDHAQAGITEEGYPATLYDRAISYRCDCD